MTFVSAFWQFQFESHLVLNFVVDWHYHDVRHHPLSVPVLGEDNVTFVISLMCIWCCICIQPTRVKRIINVTKI